MGDRRALREIWSPESEGRCEAFARGETLKRCRTCRCKFEPKVSSLQTCCSTECALTYARLHPENRQSERKRIVAAEKTIGLEKLKSLTQVLEET